MRIDRSKNLPCKKPKNDCRSSFMVALYTCLFFPWLNLLSLSLLLRHARLINCFKEDNCGTKITTVEKVQKVNTTPLCTTPL
jgi:hypothetical protein